MAARSKKRRKLTEEEWELIRLEYVNAPGKGISQEALAKRHGVYATTLKNRARSQGWVAARKLALMKMEEQVLEKVIQDVARAAAESSLTAVAQLREVRTMLLQKVKQDLIEDAMRLDEDAVVDTERIPKTRDDQGRVVKNERVLQKKMRRTRPRADTRLVQAILKTEVEHMRILLGRNDRQDPDPETRPPLRIE